MVAVGGGVGGDVSGSVVERGGFLSEVIGGRLANSEGEIGGEHFVLHAGQFLFDDTHWILS